MEMIDIKNYVEKYLERIFAEPIKIDIQDNKYILNGKLNFESYSFWNKTDEESDKIVDVSYVAIRYLGNHGRES